MRRITFRWTYTTLAIVLFIYGGYILLYNMNKGKGLSILALVFFIVGSLMLLLYLVLFIYSCYKNKNKKVEEKPIPETPRNEESIKEEVQKEEIKPVETPKKEKKEYDASKEVTYVSSRSYKKAERSSYSYSTCYVKKMGYGPVLRVSGNQILDMRNNTYYRIEGSNVMMEGSGPAYEISGNRIRHAYGGYLYEISGSNINKIYGGFYASISGSYITKFDGSEKYEITDSLSSKQLLAVAALIFE